MITFTSGMSKTVATCSDIAKDKIQQAIDDYKNESGLDVCIRLFVAERGCSGMAYEMEFICTPDICDAQVEDLKLYIKADSIMWLLGAHIDYEDTELTSGFKFINPQNKKSCHCGEAFYG